MSATVRAKMMAERARDGGAGVAETAQESARLRAQVKALFDRRWEEEDKWGKEEATNRRWEARVGGCGRLDR